MTLRYIAWTVTRGSVVDGLKAPQTKPTGLFSMTNIVKANDEKQWQTCPVTQVRIPAEKTKILKIQVRNPARVKRSIFSQTLEEFQTRSNQTTATENDFEFSSWAKKNEAHLCAEAKKNQKVTRVLWAGDQSFLFCRLSVSFQSRSTLLQWFYS